MKLMGESIHNRKLQQTTYLRQLQEEKAAKKRELMAQQSKDLTDLRSYYSEENKKLDQTTADAVSHIRDETRDMVNQYADDRKQQQEQEKLYREDQKASQRDSAGGTREASSEQDATYNRRGQKKPAIQNYETKETDDFYRVQNRGSRVTEDNSKYVIEAFAPEHEKDNLRVSVQRNKAIVSGKRKFGDTATEGNKKMSTNNFQTFREEFKFSRPVSEAGMTRERVGDYVRFTIPKLEAMDSSDDES